MRTRSLIAVTVLFVTAACAPAAYSGSGSSHNSSVITREEILQSPAQNAFAIVRALRPQWLHRATPQTIRGDEEVVVYFGQARMGGLDALRDITPMGIEKIEYLDASAAQLRFGVGHLNGAIVVTPASD